MALPRVNSTSWFDIEIPSNKEKIQIRPFLVKEQKILLLAGETQDKVQIINAMLDTIASCTRDKIDTKKLTTFDVDYIFAQIRSKSVGETSTLIFKCRQCDHKNDVVVNIADAKVEGEIANPIVELTPEIKVKMMYPSYHSMTKNDALLNNDDTTSMAFEFIKMCMVSVITDEEQVMLRDETDESVQNFIDSLSAEQFNKMTTFLENVPKMKTKVNFKCESCESDQHATLEGLEDFF